MIKLEFIILDECAYDVLGLRCLLDRNFYSQQFRHDCYVFFFSSVSSLLRHKRSHLFVCAGSCLFYLLVNVVPTASCELAL